MYRYYIGPRAFILINDLDMLKQIMVKDFDSFSDHTVSSGYNIIAHCLSTEAYELCASVLYM